MTTPLDTIKSAIIGNPPVANKKPSRTGVVRAFAEMQVQLEGAQSGAFVAATKTQLTALISFAEFGAMGWVTNDPTLANNGIYQKSDTGGAGSWVRITDIPQFMISGVNVGAGTANAIQVTTDLPLPTQDGRALIAIPIATDNTASPVTIAINGGTALTIKTNSGANIPIGGLTEGMIAVGFKVGSTFRLLSDYASAAILAAAEAVLEEFQESYLGAYATAPATDPNGNALQEGAIYWNTTSNLHFVWNGASFDALPFATVPDGSITPAKLDSSQISIFNETIVGNARIDLKIHHDMLGGDDADDAEKFQDAIAAEPKNTYFALPRDDYFFSEAVNITKTVSVDLGHSNITSGGTGDALRIAVAIGAPTNGDGRNMTISGGRIIGPSGGYAGLNVNPSGGTDQASIFQLMIENGIYAGPLRAIRFGGAAGGPTVEGGGETAFNTVWNCYLETYVDSLDAASLAVESEAADGNRLMLSKTAGYGKGVRINLTPGAFNTTLAFNAMVNRDGAIDIVNGSRIVGIGNQLEQFAGYGENESALSTMLIVQGTTRKSIGCSWWWNNFGGGGNVDYNAIFMNSRGHVVNECQFNLTNTADIWFRDEGATYSALNVIGPNNQPRGTRSQRAAPTDASRRLNIVMDTNSRNNRGVFRPGSHMTLANSSTAANLEFMVTDYGILMFDGDLVAGITSPTGGDPDGLLATMPIGARPRVGYTRRVFADDGAIVDLFFATTGEIFLASTITGSQTINMTGVSHFVLWCHPDDYDVGE